MCVFVLSLSLFLSTAIFCAVMANAFYVFPGKTVSRLRSYEDSGYRRAVALIRESGNGDSETFEPFLTPVLLSRLELGGVQLGGCWTPNAMHTTGEPKIYDIEARIRKNN